MKKHLLVLLFCMPLFAAAQDTLIRTHPGRTHPQTGAPLPLETEYFTMERMMFQGNPIGYWRFLPPGYDATNATAHPVIIFLHGGFPTRNDPDLEGELFEILNDGGLPNFLPLITSPAQWTFNSSAGPKSPIVLIPQKHKDTFIPPGQTGETERQFPAYYIDAMLSIAASLRSTSGAVKADMSRVYLTGLSLGSGITWDYPSLSDENARRIAAIVPVSGHPILAYDLQAGPGSPANICNLAEHGVEILAYIGSNDFLLEQARTADAHYENECDHVPTKLPAGLLEFAGYSSPHSGQFWNDVYHPANPSTEGHNVTTHEIPNMYEWMLQFTSVAGGALPVDLVYFKGKNLSDANILDWSTSAEINFDRFEIMRSSDGSNFVTIATLPASSSTRNVREYTYKDKAPRGVSYYKVKLIDKDGKFKFTNVIVVDNKNQAFVVEKYPNPVIDQLNLTVDGSIFGTLEFTILDMQGNLVQRMNARKDQALWKGFMNVQRLAKGVYTIRMQSSDGRKDISTFVKK